MAEKGQEQTADGRVVWAVKFEALFPAIISTPALKTHLYWERRFHERRNRLTFTIYLAQGIVNYTHCSYADSQALIVFGNVMDMNKT